MEVFGGGGFGDAGSGGVVGVEEGEVVGVAGAGSDEDAAVGLVVDGGDGAGDGEGDVGAGVGVDGGVGGEVAGDVAVGLVAGALVDGDLGAVGGDAQGSQLRRRCGLVVVSWLPKVGVVRALRPVWSAVPIWQVPVA
ncbi:hypothetical protein [Plantactinospora veratri]